MSKLTVKTRPRDRHGRGRRRARRRRRIVRHPSRERRALRHVFEGRAQALQAISSVDELITQTNFALGDAVLDSSAQKTAAVVKATGQRIESIDALLGHYLRYPLDADEAQRAKHLADNWATLRDKGLRPTARLLGENNLSEAQWIVTQQIDPAIKRVKQESTELRAFQLTAAQQEYDDAQRVSRIVEWTVGACILAGVALVGWLCLSMARTLIGQLGGEPDLVATVARRIAQGDLATDVPLERGDTRSLMHAMSLMCTQLASMVGNIKRSTETIGVAAAEITERQSCAVGAHRTARGEPSADVRDDGADRVDGARQRRSHEPRADGDARRTANTP